MEQVKRLVLADAAQRGWHLRGSGARDLWRSLLRCDITDVSEGQQGWIGYGLSNGDHGSFSTRPEDLEANRQIRRLVGLPAL